jgi:hypothetical protein
MPKWQPFICDFFIIEITKVKIINVEGDNVSLLITTENTNLSENQLVLYRVYESTLRPER